MYVIYISEIDRLRISLGKSLSVLIYKVKTSSLKCFQVSVLCLGEQSAIYYVRSSDDLLPYYGRTNDDLGRRTSRFNGWSSRQ